MAYALYILILFAESPKQKRDTYQHIFGGLALCISCENIFMRQTIY